MPIRKVGRLTPISEPASKTCDSKLCLRKRRIDAERNADEQREQRGDIASSKRGRQAAPSSRTDTGRACRSESPKSPWTALPMKRANCT